MLLNFRVSNFRSFRDEVCLDFEETRLDPEEGFPTQVARDGSTSKVLPVIAILGANASGKSNVLKAMSKMRELVTQSSYRRRGQALEVTAFALDKDSVNRPTEFELGFTLNGVRYQYGFQIQRGLVREEWLHAFPYKRAAVVFDRTGRREYQFGRGLATAKMRTLSELTRPDTLFLSSAAQAEVDFITPIYDFFTLNLSLLDMHQRIDEGVSVIDNLGKRHKRAVDLLAKADLGIVGAEIREGSHGWSLESLKEAMEFQLPRDMTEAEKEAHLEATLAEVARSARTLELVHKSRATSMALPFSEESLGTRSWLSLVSHSLEALDAGGSLLVDELDASLHPILMAEAIELFRHRESNPGGAQLIFTTHDVTMLANDFTPAQLPRGAIWLAEKGVDGSTRLVPLSDYRPRKGEDLARGYLQGRYGGVPRLPERAFRSQARLVGQDDG